MKENFFKMITWEQTFKNNLLVVSVLVLLIASSFVSVNAKSCGDDQTGLIYDGIPATEGIVKNSIPC